jgi:hypothetical protein
MGHRVSIIALENLSSRPCLLSGYPTVTLTGSDGRPLTSVKAEQRPGSFLRPGQEPTPVTLPGRAKAYFDLAWTAIPNEAEGQTTCPTANHLRITPPGDNVFVGLRKTFEPCGGKVEVSPLRPVGEPVR